MEKRSRVQPVGPLSKAEDSNLLRAGSRLKEIPAGRGQNASPLGKPHHTSNANEQGPRQKSPDDHGANNERKKHRDEWLGDYSLDKREQA